MRRAVNNISILMVLAGVLLFAAPVYAEIVVPKDLGLGQTAKASMAGGRSLSNRLPGTLPEIIGQAVGAVLAFVGVIFLLLIIYGGFTWMLAHGKEEYAKKAKDTIFSAVIGLIVVLSSYAITQFVFSALEGSKATPPPKAPAAANAAAQEEANGGEAQNQLPAAQPAAAAPEPAPAANPPAAAQQPLCQALIDECSHLCTQRACVPNAQNLDQLCPGGNPIPVITTGCTNECRQIHQQNC